MTLLCVIREESAGLMKIFDIRSLWQVSIGHLLLAVFGIGVLVATIVLLLAFNNYRHGAVSDMARADGGRISHLVFEHLYSVMRKGVTRDEVDDLIHHIQGQLPGYKVSIVRGEPVARQFGERPGQAEMRQADPLLARAFVSKQDVFIEEEQTLRYLFPLQMSSECQGCHAQAQVGEVNGVISVSVPLSTLAKPLVDVAKPVMYVALVLVFSLFVLTFMVVRKGMIQPISDLATHVSDLSSNADYARDLEAFDNWPREVRSLAENFNGLMAQVRVSHDQLRLTSMRDPLTGLFNRRRFDSACSQASLDADTVRTPYGILMVDLDRFKPINDQYGHAAGDAVLISVARELQALLREGDLVARIGGDEFALLCIGLDKAGIAELIRRIKERVEAISLRFGGDEVHPSCSVGAACYPEDGKLAEDLLRHADAAMYVDKARRGEPR